MERLKTVFSLQCLCSLVAHFHTVGHDHKPEVVALTTM